MLQGSAVARWSGPYIYVCWAEWACLNCESVGVPGEVYTGRVVTEKDHELHRRNYFPKFRPFFLLFLMFFHNSDSRATIYHRFTVTSLVRTQHEVVIVMMSDYQAR